MEYPSDLGRLRVDKGRILSRADIGQTMAYYGTEILRPAPTLS